MLSNTKYQLIEDTEFCNSIENNSKNLNENHYESKTTINENCNSDDIKNKKSNEKLIVKRRNQIFFNLPENKKCGYHYEKEKLRISMKKYIDQNNEENENNIQNNSQQINQNMNNNHTSNPQLKKLRSYKKKENIANNSLGNNEYFVKIMNHNNLYFNFNLENKNNNPNKTIISPVNKFLSINVYQILKT